MDTSHIKQLIAEQKFNEIENIIIEHLQGSPGDQEAILYLGKIYFYTKQYNKAEKLFEHECVHNPNPSPAIYFNLANARIKTRKIREAIALLDRIIKISGNQLPEDKKAELYSTYADAYFSIEKYKDAEYYLQLALNINPNRSAFLYNMVLVHLHTGDIKKEKEYMGKACLAIGPSSDRKAVAAILYSEMGATERILEILDEIKDNPTLYQFTLNAIRANSQKKNLI